VRRLGTLFVVLGIAAGTWGVVVWQWQDPFTALYTTYEQHQLAGAYANRAQKFEVPVGPSRVGSSAGAHTGASTIRRPDPKGLTSAVTASSLAAEERAISRQARIYRLDSHEGDPVGRLIIKRLGLDMIVVNGTDEASLERGPGRDLQTFMPGEDRLVYIAGHRTTFLAPFSNINVLRAGDKIKFELPYATFVYSVTRHVIVPADDLAVLRSGDHELLALQACHPRFFATHRYIVYARVTKVIPSTAFGHAYTPDVDQTAA
jgi:sortase A